MARFYVCDELLLFKSLVVIKYRLLEIQISFMSKTILGGLFLY